MTNQSNKQILLNKAKCAKCGDTIESKYCHDFKWCKCGEIAVDGGHEYLKRCFKSFNSVIELSEFTKE